MAPGGGIVDYPEYSLKQQSVYAQDRIDLHRPPLSRPRAALRLDRAARRRTGTRAMRRSRSTTASSRRAPRCSTPWTTASRPTSATRNPSTRRRSAPMPPATPFEPTRGTPVRGRREVPAAGHQLALHRGGLRDHQVEHPGHRPDQSELRAIQEGEAKSRGIELGAQADWRGFSVDAGYTYLDTENEAGERFAGRAGEPGLGLAAVRRRGPARRARWRASASAMSARPWSAASTTAERHALRRDARLPVGPLPGAADRAQPRGQDLCGELRRRSPATTATPGRSASR